MSDYLTWPGHTVRKDAIVHIEWHTYTRSQGSYAAAKREGNVVVHLINGETLTIERQETIEMLDYLIKEEAGVRPPS